MGNAEAADRRLEAVSDREHEHHPAADPHHQQTTRQPTNPGQRNTVTARSHMRREPRHKTQRHADHRQQPNQDKVVACGRDGMDELLRDEEHRRHRTHQAPKVEPPLARLAKNNKNEHRVDEVISNCHAPIIDRPPLAVVGARVEPRVDFCLNPKVDSDKPQPTKVDQSMTLFGRTASNNDAGPGGACVEES